MTQNRFSDLAILNIERELSNVINNDDILKLFSSKYRRIVIIYNVNLFLLTYTKLYFDSMVYF